MTIKTAIAEPLPLSPAEREQSFAASAEMVEIRAQRDAGGRKVVRRVVDEEAFARWIAAVREIGDPRHAASLAFGERAWQRVDSLLAACRADPLRQRELDGARDHFHARIHRELVRRGIEGTDVAKWHDGQIVGYEKQFDGKIALGLAAWHLRMIEKRQDISVSHTADANSDVLFSLTFDVVQRMPIEIRKNLLTPLLEWIRADRAKLAGEAMPAIEEPTIDSDDREYDTSRLAAEVF